MDPARVGSLDEATVEGFGFEWSTYDQSDRDEASLRAAFDRYVSLFPWDDLPEGSQGVDIGCGSGRWSRLAEEYRVRVIALDASSDALAVARDAAGLSRLVRAGATELPLRDASMDFAFSLGVLHHVVDAASGLAEAHRVLRPGAPFLVYLYYALENRPAWYRVLWRTSDLLRRVIARSPDRVRLATTRLIALMVYLPIARSNRLLARFGVDVDSLPLAAYRDQPLYVMRTDALDRFGTRVEQRYTRAEISRMLEVAGFRDVVFRDGWPYWCAVARA